MRKRHLIRIRRRGLPHPAPGRIVFLLLRKAAAGIASILSLPALKPVVLTITAVFLLLAAVPYGVSLLSKGDADSGGMEERADFQPAELPDTVDLYRTEAERVETVDFEDYVKGVVSGEVPSEFHREALKAQAVAARTYSAARIIKAREGGNPQAHPSAPLCDSTHCQVYRSPEELEELKGEGWMDKGWKKISSAVEATEGQLLYYKSRLVEQALFHSSSGGKTENSEDVFASAYPYLVSVDSPYETQATHRNEKNSFSMEEFSEKIKTAYPQKDFGSVTASSIYVESRSQGGRVDEMKIGSAILSGRQVREALGLPSANFTVEASENTVTFTSSGSGHGVGMSQYGADGMAREGYDYKEILSHYYSGTEVY